MPEGQVLEFSDVTKRFRGVDAVAGLTARVDPGVVTGFLGPNGAGKTTSLRILLGLVAPTSGRTRIGGASYAELPHPLQTVGAALEASSFHPGRSAAHHLAVYAQAAGLPGRRIDEVLGLVGLADVAGRKVGGYSLGMRQRLGLATALLGDPGVLVLDEPANGLDPEGIKWMRTLLRAFAAEGRTVLVSSHLLAEIQQTADQLLILAHGQLVFEGGIEDLADPSEYATVVDAPDRAALAAAVAAAGYDSEVLRTGLTVRGAEPVEIGAIAASAGIALSSLQRRGPALEEIFLALVDGTRVHGQVATDAAAPSPDDAAPQTPALADEASEVDGAPVDEVPVDEVPVDEVPVDEPAVDEPSGPADTTPGADADEPVTAPDTTEATPAAHGDLPAADGDPLAAESLEDDGTAPSPRIDASGEGGLLTEGVPASDPDETDATRGETVDAQTVAESADAASADEETTDGAHPFPDHDHRDGGDAR
ncbi:ATP-binding cassette domain-containing protein [Microbacterium sp. 18062]|uniref:ATP-binding cassette domain-containing protein n=1 Tax=Microbacterium sp. 18062 TaxID=2681410 RepID=UPI001358F45A|nr:ATP-binding cassette domain-containing protein [Microbacterium sp. 18062]